MSPRAQVFFLFSLSRPSSSLAPRHVIFPRIKLSWWNKAEGVRRRGRGRSLGLWLLSLMNLSDWRDEAEPAIFPFTGSCCVSFSLSLFFLCPFKSLHFHFLTFTLFYLLFFSSITLSVLDFSPSPCPCLILNSITKPFYWLAILKINLADKSETLLLSVSFSLSSPPTTHTHTHTHTHRLGFPQMSGFGIHCGRLMKKCVWVISTRMLVLPAERRFTVDIWYSYSVISTVFLSPFLPVLINKDKLWI